ncbi:VOC family protein [Noviherbaspirillum cavernae]|uniref:VOC family protein n=1 Tax=Noviherbaspirillum cavernae TaxID=2320862 RepID=A0A418WZX5_9BURK|nr:VOC family protein [Noviherbaspirillum cavernae]RJG05615.1 VOC family protein [Noviherbaspirillum cavernae]
MTTLAATPIGQTADIPAAVSISGLHHLAYRCRDAEETRHFYEDILGLPLFHYIRNDIVPSTGEFCPYVHIFFRMTDGSCIAFFDLGDDVMPAPSPNTPAWVSHVAFSVASVAQLEAMKARLVAHGVDVLGVTDHRIFKSIYFFDPNGVRLELCAQLAPEAQMASEQQGVREKLAAWTKEKAERLAQKKQGRE